MLQSLLQIVSQDLINVPRTVNNFCNCYFILLLQIKIFGLSEEIQKMQLSSQVHREYQQKFSRFSTSFMKIASAILCCCTSTHTKIPRNTSTLFPGNKMSRNFFDISETVQLNAGAKVSAVAISALCTGCLGQDCKINMTGMQKALRHRRVAQDEINWRNRSSWDRDK